MQTRFTLLMQDKPIMLRKIEAQVEEHFNSFTIRLGSIGYWKNTREASLAVEVITGFSDEKLSLAETRATLHVLALQLKALLEQEAILLTEEPIKAEFI